MASITFFNQKSDGNELIEHKTSLDHGSLQDWQIEIIDPQEGRGKSCRITRGCVFIFQTVTSIVSMAAILPLLRRNVEDLVELKEVVEPYRKFVKPVYWLLNRNCPSRELMVFREQIDSVVDHYHPFPMQALSSSSEEIGEYPELEIIEKTKKGAYRKLDSKSIQFKQLLEKYGAKKVLVVMREIEVQMHYIRLRKSPLLIKEPLKLIQKALECGHPFLSRPIASLSNHSLIPDLQWSGNELCLNKTETFSFKTPKDAAKVANLPTERRFQNKQDIKKVFDFFKENIPTAYAESGCSYRAEWIVQVLHVFLKYKVDRLRIFPPQEANTFTMRFPFPKVTWRLHEVAIVYMQDETRWVFDMAIPEPMSFERWKAALHTPTQGRNLREFFAKKPFYEINCNKEILFTQTLIRMHRLYLMQHVIYTE